MIRSAAAFAVGLAFAGAAGGDETQSAAASAGLWETAIKNFEKIDQKDPPPKDPILFVGSSTIRFWDLKSAFPEFTVLNRGFGGSTAADLNRYAERIVFPYRPRQVVVYSGDNDIALGQTPEQVIQEFRTFVAAVRERLPEVPIVLLGVKPSVSRWHLMDQFRKVNAALTSMAEADPKITYVNTEPLVLGAEGRPDPALFQNDGLHLSPLGYARWNDALRPLLLPPRPE